MELYIPTEKFTLIPKHLYRPEYPEEMFAVGKNETVKCIELHKHNAILSFAAPAENNEQIKPLIYKLIEISDTLQEHNKIVINYSPDNKTTYLVAMEGEKLLLANTYRTSDIKGLLYFLTLAVQQVMFNPLHTRITSFGSMNHDDIKILEEYFCGVIVIDNNKL